jgi:hypothetical protein
VVSSTSAINVPHAQLIPRLSVEEVPTLSVSPPGATAPQEQKERRPKNVAPLELGVINPVHRMPFNLESHTQQGADEYHAEENQVRSRL